MPASPGGTPRGENGARVANGKAVDKRRSSPKSANRGQKRARLDSQDVPEKESTRKCTATPETCLFI